MSIEKKLAILGSLSIVVIVAVVFAMSGSTDDIEEAEDPPEPEPVLFTEVPDASTEDPDTLGDLEELEEPQAPQKWTRIAAGNEHTCGLQTEGSLWCWGKNSHGQLGLGDRKTREDPAQVGDASDWTDLSAGSHHSCAIREDGSLWCWGRNDHGALGDGSSNEHTAPVQVPGENWTAVAAGAFGARRVIAVIVAAAGEGEREE